MGSRMRALAYADWCVARRSMRPYVISSALIAAAVAAGQVIGQGEVTLAVTCSFASCMALVLLFNVTFMLFGIDEQGEWAQGRFALLPVTRTDAVSARYAMVAAITAAGLLVALPLGAAYQLVASAVAGLPCSWEVVPEVGFAASAFMLVAIGVLSVQMPILFALGLQRGRTLAMLPFLAFVALAFGGQAVSEGAGQLLQALLALPTPALLGATLAICTLLYLASLILSQHLYAHRTL